MFIIYWILCILRIFKIWDEIYFLLFIEKDFRKINFIKYLVFIIIFINILIQKIIKSIVKHIIIFILFIFLNHKLLLLKKYYILCF